MTKLMDLNGRNIELGSNQANKISRRRKRKPYAPFCDIFHSGGFLSQIFHASTLHQQKSSLQTKSLMLIQAHLYWSI